MALKILLFEYLNTLILMCLICHFIIAFQSNLISLFVIKSILPFLFLNCFHFYVPLQ